MDSEEVTVNRECPSTSHPFGLLLHHQDTFVESPVIPTLKDVSNQIIAACISALTVVQVGLNISYSAVLLPQLEDKNSDYKISRSESSWIASLLVLSTPVGALLSGPISDRIGRKKGNLLVCAPMLIAWSICAFSPKDTIIGLYFARVLAGLGGGMSTVFIVYVSEICHEKYRPMLLGLNSVAVSLGVLVVSACGVYMNWRLMAFWYAVLAAVTFFLILLFIPESPQWFMMISDRNDSRTDTEKALKWLYPKKELYQNKLGQILESSRKMKEERSNQKTETRLIGKIRRLILSFISPETLLPILILMGLILFQQLSGGYSIIFYTINIFKKLGTGIDEYVALQVMGIIRFIMSIISAGLSRVIGRRALLFISSFGMAVSSFIVTISQNNLSPSSYNSTSYINSNSTIEPFILLSSNHGNWLPIASIIAFVCMSAVGLLNIPWTIMGELLPTATRGVGTGFLISFAYVLMFVTVHIYPFLLDTMNVGTLFLIQGIICLLTIIFVYFFLPETLGKSLNEIEQHFLKKINKK